LDGEKFSYKFTFNIQTNQSYKRRWKWNLHTLMEILNMIKDYIDLENEEENFEFSYEWIFFTKLYIWESKRGRKPEEKSEKDSWDWKFF
jgi:hypothetical protein